MIGQLALRQINNQIAQDAWTQAIFTAAGVQFDILAQRIIDMYNFNDFSKLSEKWCSYYETALGIANHSDDIGQRRSAIEARWKSGIIPTNKVIQAVCDSWASGECVVTFDNATSTIKITFNSAFGVPAGLDALKAAIEIVKPAHLGISWGFTFYLISEVEAMTLAELETKTLNKFAR